RSVRNPALVFGMLVWWRSCSRSSTMSKLALATSIPTHACMIASSQLAARRGAQTAPPLSIRTWVQDTVRRLVRTSTTGLIYASGSWPKGRDSLVVVLRGQLTFASLYPISKIQGEGQAPPASQVIQAQTERT